MGREKVRCRGTLRVFTGTHMKLLISPDKRQAVNLELVTHMQIDGRDISFHSGSGVAVFRYETEVDAKAAWERVESYAKNQ
jgi:hypothetical protein